MAQSATPFSDDKPIVHPDEDSFRRLGLANSIADDLSLGTSALVAALVGPWGSGKTSVLNLVKARLEERPREVVVVDFNPWLFAGTHELVQRFFGELAAQLASRQDKALQSTASRLENYAQLLAPLGSVPVAGGFAKTVGSGAGFLGSLMRSRARFGSSSLHTERKAIEAALAATNRRVVIVIDDIDRLEPPEVRDIVRLVRLVADFPRTSYLLAFDRQRVESALGLGDPDLGRDYLEKIVQLLYPLPLPARRDVAAMTFTSIDAAIENLPVRPLDERYWGNVKTLVVEPLLKTPRDARRYANAMRTAVRDLGEEINLVDLLALEVFRVLMPKVFDQLPGLIVPLTTTNAGFIGGSDPLGSRRDEYRRALATLVSEAGDRSDAVSALLAWVFPASRAITGNMNYGPEWAQQWRAERRVANVEVLAIYLSRALPPGVLATPIVDAVFGALAGGDELPALLEGLDDSSIEELLERLEDFETKFPDDPLDAVVALQNLLPRLPHRRSLLFGLGAETRLHRVILRLLRKVSDSQRRGDIVRAALPRVRTLSGRLSLLFVAGDRKNLGSELISSVAQADLEDQLRGQIRAVSIDSLRGERDLLRLFGFLAESKDPDYAAFIETAIADDGVLVGMLRSALSETSSQTIGDVTVQREAVLPWEWLISVVSEAELVRRIDELKASDDDGARDMDAEAVRVAKRYAGGWRPVPFSGPRRDDDDEQADREVDNGAGTGESESANDAEDGPQGLS